MTNKYPDYWHYLWGSVPLGALYAFITWSLVAATISLLVNVINRNPASATTPIKTSWKFMLLDNTLRIVVNLLAVPVFIRLALLKIPPEWMFIPSIIIGVMIDRLALLLKNLGVLAGDRFTAKIKARLLSDDTNDVIK